MIDTPGGAAPLVSIVVVTYNAADYVRRCLESVRSRTRVPCELIVVDNASERDTREYLESLDGIHLILNEENRLWCAGCNQGMRASDPRSSYVLLLNSDIEVLREDWLEVMVSLIESDPRIGIVGPHRIPMRYGPLYGHIDGDCFLFRRELLQQVGYFDEERWPWAGANVEFTVAAFARGWIYKMVHPDDRIVVHHGQKSRTPDLQKRIVRLPKPRRKYRDILLRHGIRPSFAPLERSRLLGPILRHLDRTRFYYAEPFGPSRRLAR
jgi:GT2 family glycosyltransferase